MQLVRWVITFCMLSLLTMSTADAAQCDKTASVTAIVVDLDSSNTSPDLDDCALTTNQGQHISYGFVVTTTEQQAVFNKQTTESIRAPPL